MSFGTGGIGGTGGPSDSIRSAQEGIKGANQAVLDVMQELHEFMDSQDMAMKSEKETQLREQIERLSGMLANAESGGLTGIRPTSVSDFQSVVDEARMGGSGNSEVIQQAQQLIDDIKAQMSLSA